MIGASFWLLLILNNFYMNVLGGDFMVRVYFENGVLCKQEIDYAFENGSGYGETEEVALNALANGLFGEALLEKDAAFKAQDEERLHNEREAMLLSMLDKIDEKIAACK